jgi:hypothetical protein
MIDKNRMKSEEYRKLAAYFRDVARTALGPAFRAEMEDIAKCYDSAAEQLRC